LQYRLNKIELLEATNPDNPEAKFIAKKREGVHHVAFQVDDIRAKWNG
jgi:methylmalonyl-CoA/ethylmalonyl-CoA epimerase